MNAQVLSTIYLNRFGGIVESGHMCSIELALFAKYFPHTSIS